MKQMKTIIILLSILYPILMEAQKLTDELIYRRSSLYTLMISENNRQYASEIQKTFINAAIPDKFNNHSLSMRKIPNAVVGHTKKEEKIRIQQANISDYLEKNEIAKQLVAKWFNRSAKGIFNIQLLAERGMYNASDMDIQLARSSKRGMTLLADAGEELIKNTFVIVNDFDYISKEKVADKSKAGLSLLKDIAEMTDVDIDTKTTDVLLTTFGKGYVIRTFSYLYQLEWTDSVAAVFYEEYWIDKDKFDTAKKAAFDNSDIFKLKYIGYEIAWADLQSTSYTKKSEEELIRIATIRAMDAAIAKLQKKYEVFRTKTPLYSSDPIAAKIGLKEGVEKGGRFEVLEQVMDNKGRTHYKRKGIIKVDKNHIWDNRFAADEDPNNKQSQLNFTVFKGSGKFYKGMLIRQIN